MGLFRRGKKKQEAPGRVGPDILAQAGQAMQRREDADVAGYVQGRHYTEWVPTLDEWRTAGAAKEDEYLGLLLEIIDATERVASIKGLDPAPGYTKRAAIVYRRRKDYAAELSILRRYGEACPPGRGGGFSERMQKVETLLKAAP